MSRLTNAQRRARSRAIKAERLTVPMQPGELIAQMPDDPVLKVIGYGPQTYVWIGNETGACFATLDGKGLRRLVGRFVRAAQIRASRPRGARP